MTDAATDTTSTAPPPVAAADHGRPPAEAGVREQRFRPAADRVAYLDGLRAVAALMVFVGHAAGAGLLPLAPLGTVGYSIVTHGPYGVTIFFVLSAYTLCMSVAPALEGRQVSWRAYFIRRFFRIAPLYYFVLLYAAYVGTNLPERALSLFLHMSFINMFMPQYANDLLSVEWTIAVEWQFYILFPALVLLARSRSGLAALVVIAAVLLFERNRLFDALPPPYSTYRGFSALFHLYAFVGGLVVYVAARQKVAPASRRAIMRCLNVLSFGLVAFMIWRGNAGYSGALVAIVTGVVILNAESNGVARSVLSWRPLAFVGKISFSAYLLHPFFLGWVQSLGWWPVAEMFAALAGLLAAASVTYFCIERPGMRVGRLLARRVTARALALRPLSTA